jgi:predicted RNase H-like nuclease (RuvC/YqgF family)
MEFKEAMEKVGELENSDELIGAITSRIQKANQDDKDYKSVLSEKESELSKLKESFDSREKEFEQLKNSLTDSKDDEKELTIKALKEQVNELTTSFNDLSEKAKAKEKEIEGNKKAKILKTAFDKAGMISTDSTVKAYSFDVAFDSEGKLVSNDGKSIDSFVVKLLEDEPQLKKSELKKGTNSFSASSNSTISQRKQLEEFLK